MSYVMFENTSNDMQDLIDKMYEEDFHPDKLSKSERKYFDALYDQVTTMYDRLDEILEMMQQEEDERYEAEDAEEARQEEYEMHKAIVGQERADEDFNVKSTDYFSVNSFTRDDNSSTDSDSNTFSRED